MTTKPINLTAIMNELSLRKLAFYGSSHLGNDTYYLKEFIDLMIGFIGEEKVIELLKEDSSKLNQTIGKNWYKKNGMKEKLRVLDEIIEKTKNAYDLIQDKEILENISHKKTKKHKEEIKMKIFKKRFKYLPLIKPELYSLFIFLMNSTSIKYWTIRQDLFKILENKYKKIGQFSKERIGDSNFSQRTE